MDAVIYYGFESEEIVGASRVSPAPVNLDITECYMIMRGTTYIWGYL